MPLDQQQKLNLLQKELVESYFLTYVVPFIEDLTSPVNTRPEQRWLPCFLLVSMLQGVESVRATLSDYYPSQVVVDKLEEIGRIVTCYEKPKGPDHQSLMRGVKDYRGGEAVQPDELPALVGAEVRQLIRTWLFEHRREIMDQLKQKMQDNPEGSWRDSPRAS